jgi:hypothetical protein
MKEEHLHVADENLLLHASGELRPSRSRQIRSHLERCLHCRARLEELEKTLAEFGAAHRQAWSTELPPASEPRARLTAQLTRLPVKEWGSGWLSLASKALIEHRQGAVFVGVVIAACLLFAMRVRGPAEEWPPTTGSLAQREKPDLRLTPGATVPVTKNEVCGQAMAAASTVIPASLRRKVFELYEVMPPQPDAYEVDYLITPELGGATDIRNLWPEPYGNTVWNARVKDQLEERLHRMVCRGDVDLATAQHDISTDWIAAYRKYFHADRPVSDDSSANFSSFRRSLPST